MNARHSLPPGRRMRVNRLMVLALGTALLICPFYAFGQHGGHGGGRGGAPRSTGTGGTSDSSLTDFNHALAVQARPDQASEFRTLTESTAAARKRAQDLRTLAENTKGAAEFSQQAAALKDAVEQAQDSNKSFLKGFSKSQKSGLKEITKKLNKADS